jgi:hypothetical protein
MFFFFFFFISSYSIQKKFSVKSLSSIQTISGNSVFIHVNAKGKDISSTNCFFRGVVSPQFVSGKEKSRFIGSLFFFYENNVSTFIILYLKQISSHV